MDTIIGVFIDRIEADLAMEDFENHGYRNVRQISFNSQGLRDHDDAVGEKGGMASDMLRGLTELIGRDAGGLLPNVNSQTKILVVPVENEEDRSRAQEIMRAHRASKIKNQSW